MEEQRAETSRDMLSVGLIGLLKPAVQELDERVLAVRYVPPQPSENRLTARPSVAAPPAVLSSRDRSIAGCS